MKKWNIIRILGISICLVGAYLMAFGEPLIGVEHTGIATIVGITGIGVLSMGNSLAAMEKAKGGN